MNIGGMTQNDLVESTGSVVSATIGRRSVAGLVFISLVSTIVAPGTTAGILVDPSILRPAASKTDAGQAETEGTEHVATLAELRRLTGLTWDQVASLFEVSRRAVHFWASGKPMAAAHQEHLQRSLGCLRAVDQGNAPANRHALFATNAEGIAPFDLLGKRQYEAFVLAMGRQAARSTTMTRPIRVSSERLPMSPKALAGAKEEPAHREAGLPRRARVVRA